MLECENRSTRQLHCRCPPWRKQNSDSLYVCRWVIPTLDTSSTYHHYTLIDLNAVLGVDVVGLPGLSSSHNKSFFLFEGLYPFVHLAS
ncbi:hypothetical protein TNCV_3401491 [Trichonephila clavipes]|nr:hypothetical protein TNCV_3401491 [Trichonephila clavipes]